MVVTHTKKVKTGVLYTILKDSFIAHIQTASERKGAASEGTSISLREYRPYPTKLLREILANAVAHALYQRHRGEIIVDIHLDRVMVRNNAPLEAEVFANQWFSQRTMAKNKLLMEALHTAGITDELGTGKANVFRLAIEAGKEEPSIDFFKDKNFAKWHITVYNSHRHEHIDNLLSKINDSSLPSPLHKMIAVALILWKDRQWSEIKHVWTIIMRKLLTRWSGTTILPSLSSMTIFLYAAGLMLP